MRFCNFWSFMCQLFLRIKLQTKWVNFKRSSQYLSLSLWTGSFFFPLCQVRQSLILNRKKWQWTIGHSCVCMFLLQKHALSSRKRTGIRSSLLHWPIPQCSGREMRVAKAFKLSPTAVILVLPVSDGKLYSTVQQTSEVLWPILWQPYGQKSKLWMMRLLLK